MPPARSVHGRCHLGLARTFQQLPERLQSTFVQLMTMSATEFLEQWFETDPLIATMSASGIIGTFQGVRSPGTAYVLLHHYMGEIDGAFRAWGFQKGGTGGVSEAIAAAAGVSITPTPFDPVLRGLLLTGRRPAFLRTELTGGHGPTSVASPEPLWWPAGKIAARYLGPYLAEHTVADSRYEPSRLLV